MEDFEVPSKIQGNNHPLGMSQKGTSQIVHGACFKYLINIWSPCAPFIDFRPKEEGSTVTVSNADQILIRSPSIRVGKRGMLVPWQPELEFTSGCSLSLEENGTYGVSM